MRLGPGGLALLLACGSPVQKPPPAAPESYRYALPVAALRIDSFTAFAEVAARPDARTQGLMYRTALAADSGMLFVFDSAEHQRFWMKNTLIPLSIAYVDSAGTITDILEMAPLDTTTPYASSRPVPYALEMSRGWFASRGIRPGATVSGLPALLR
jgi:hypothetical protein